MTLSRWFPIFVTIVGLVTPARATKAALDYELTHANHLVAVAHLEQTGLLNPLRTAQPVRTWVVGQRRPVDNYTGFPGYPLPALAPIVLRYGWHQGADGQTTFHSGIDLLAAAGTTVLAVDGGTVAFAKEQGTYGNLVVINHQGGRQTRYAHLSSIAVRTGQKVQPGTSLGTVGNTGSPDISQSHLHFEVRYSSPAGWVAQDPELHLTAIP
ncbi:MAG TPA: hypothetical protein DDZ80_31225 [Cyanobacteria bacterium UBA8803]|nr:hypothetical protein [Cyanobacteria bacterium UBA9273]HBL62688.1 hypothetical protein [Cyanobacteria bacterium UBA8803]